MTKLTLLLDEKVIKDAKKIAKRNRTSLSKMASDYFSSLSAYRADKFDDLPILREISGVLYGCEPAKGVKKSYREHLRKKHK